jgi:hypothetical protein
MTQNEALKYLNDCGGSATTRKLRAISGYRDVQDVLLELEQDGWIGRRYGEWQLLCEVKQTTGIGSYGDGVELDFILRSPTR